MCCLNSDKIGRASRASPQVPLYSVLPQIRSPHKTSLPLSTGPGTASAYPWIVGFNSLPAYRIIQTSQSHPLWEPGSTSLPSQYIQSLPPTVLVLHSAPNATPTWPCMACGVLLARPDYMWLINCCQFHLSSVGCCVEPFLTQRWESCPHQWGE